MSLYDVPENAAQAKQIAQSAGVDLERFANVVLEMRKTVEQCKARHWEPDDIKWVQDSEARAAIQTLQEIKTTVQKVAVLKKSKTVESK